MTAVDRGLIPTTYPAAMQAAVKRMFRHALSPRKQASDLPHVAAQSRVVLVLPAGTNLRIEIESECK